MRFKPARILCATDLTPRSNHALRHGIALASKFKSKLYVCNVVSMAPLGVSDVNASVFQLKYEAMLADAEKEIRRMMAKELGKDTIQWEPLVLRGEPTDGIPEAAKEVKADLVIAATHGRTGLKRLLLGSVTEVLVYNLRCPFLVVPKADRGLPNEATPAISIKKILVGVDFSPDSENALRHAVSLAQELQSEIHLVHVLEPTLYDHIEGSTGILARELERAVKEAVEKALAKLVPQEENPWCDVKRVLRHGRPNDALLSYAREEGVDLIVLGARGKGLVEKVFVGSTTDRVLRQTHCPVLTVRTEPLDL